MCDNLNKDLPLSNQFFLCNNLDMYETLLSEKVEFGYSDRTFPVIGILDNTAQKIHALNEIEYQPGTPHHHFQKLKKNLYRKIEATLSTSDLDRIKRTRAFVCIVAKGDEEGVNLRNTLLNFRDQIDSNSQDQIPFEIIIFVNTPQNKEDITSQYVAEFSDLNIHLISHSWDAEDHKQFKNNSAKIISTVRNISVGAAAYLCELSSREEDCVIIESDADLRSDNAIPKTFISSHVDFIENNDFDVFSNGRIDFARSTTPAMELFLLLTQYNHHYYDEDDDSDIPKTMRNSEANMAFPLSWYAASGGYNVAQFEDTAEGADLRSRIDRARQKLGTQPIINGYNESASLITNDRRMKSTFISGGSVNGIWNDWGESGSEGRSGRLQSGHIDAQIKIEGNTQTEIIRQMVVRNILENLGYYINTWNMSDEYFSTFRKLNSALQTFVAGSIFSTREQFRKFGITFTDDDKVTTFEEEFETSRKLADMIRIQAIYAIMDEFYKYPILNKLPNQNDIHQLRAGYDEIKSLDGPAHKKGLDLFEYTFNQCQSIRFGSRKLMTALKFVTKGIYRRFDKQLIATIIKVENDLVINEGCRQILEIKTEEFQRRYGFSDENMSAIQSLNLD